MEALLNWVKSHCPSKQRRLWETVSVRRALPRFADDSGKGGGGDDAACDDLAMVSSVGISKGTRLPVPPACILSFDVVEKSPIGIVFAGVDKYTLFALFLMWQKRVRNSHWAPYLDVLPRDVSMHPISFLRRKNAPRLRKALESHPALLRALGAQRAKLEQEWESVLQLVRLHKLKSSSDEGIKDLLGAFAGPAAPSVEEFIWANAMVISRAFNMAEPRMMCMLPFVDSMNHNLDAPNVRWRPKLPRGFFVVTVIKDIAAGEELTARYHEPCERPEQIPMDELRKFLMYGFSDRGTFDDVLEAAAAAGADI